MKEITISGIKLNMEDLKSRRELMAYLNENGLTHSALMDFCEEYREKYGNELCWCYPISDGKHLGAFLVLVREGILSLPYDEARKEDYEMFCMEDAVLFEDYAEMEIFMDDWNTFHADLFQAMTAMRDYLYNKEVLNNGKN